MNFKTIPYKSHKNQSPFTTVNISDLAISLWQDRIAKALHESSYWTRKKFWYGFIAGLIDYNVITQADYRWLSDSIEDFSAT